METSPKSETTTTTGSGGVGNHHHQPPQPPLPSPRQPTTRSEPNSPYPTTFVQADTSSFKQVVQMLTGSPKPKPTHQPEPIPKQTSTTTSTNYNTHHHHPYHHIPPMKTIPKKTQSGFKLFERRNHLKNIKINPLFNPGFGQPGSGIGSGSSPRKPEIPSPSIFDFQALALSPVTPLIPDPFGRTGSRSGSGSGSGRSTNSSSSSNGVLDTEAEEKAIKEKGFFLHPISPATTPTGVAEPPRLLPLFPVTSPRVSGADVSCSSLSY